MTAPGLKRIALGLVLGAITTVAIAWILAANVDLLNRRSLTQPARSVVIRTSELSDGGVERAFVRAAEYRVGPGALVRHVWRLPPDDADVEWKAVDGFTDDPPGWAPWLKPEYTSLAEFLAGWPWPALEATCVNTVANPMPFMSVFGDGPVEKHHLPFVPRLGGLIADTLLFGAAYASLLCAMGGLAGRVKRAMSERAVARSNAAARWLKRMATGFAITLVIVVFSAWWVALTTHPGPSGGPAITYRDPATQRDFDVIIEDGFGWRYFDAHCRSKTSFPLSSTPPPPEWMTRTLAIGESYGEVRCGWPIPALRYHGVWTDEGIKTPGLARGVTVYTTAFIHTLPVVPAWPGFLASLALWGGGYVAIVSFLAWRRGRRRGRCPGCLYDLRGLPAGVPCPECGTPVPTVQPGA